MSSSRKKPTSNQTERFTMNPWGLSWTFIFNVSVPNEGLQKHWLPVATDLDFTLWLKTIQRSILGENSKFNFGGLLTHEQGTMKLHVSLCFFIKHFTSYREFLLHIITHSFVTFYSQSASCFNSSCISTFSIITPQETYQRCTTKTLYDINITLLHSTSLYAFQTVRSTYNSELPHQVCIRRTLTRSWTTGTISSR